MTVSRSEPTAGVGAGVAAATANGSKDRIALAAIGPRVLGMVGSGWRDVRAAANPSDAELLALAQDMCQ